MHPGKTAQNDEVTIIAAAFGEPFVSFQAHLFW